MKKVIAVDASNKQVLTTRATAEKNNWWITYEVETRLTDEKNIPGGNMDRVPEIGLKMYALGARVHQLVKVEPVYVCAICKRMGRNRVLHKFYCQQHFDELVITKPIKRTQKKVNRNAKCPCNSGKKYKNCCGIENHKPHHYYNSEYMKQQEPAKQF